MRCCPLFGGALIDEARSPFAISITGKFDSRFRTDPFVLPFLLPLGNGREMADMLGRWGFFLRLFLPLRLFVFGIEKSGWGNLFNME
ncbi:MAG TPA: hypothetical protein DEA63_03090 [Firmicutes bacterium]|nr:hypothetical protein [Bacillota bacterium]